MMAAYTLVNACTDAELTDAVLASIAVALDRQLNLDLSPWWGTLGARVRAATPANPPIDGDVVALITDTLPDAPGAVAYHSWEGVPKIYAGRSLCATLTQGDGSLSQALSHECLEEEGDPAANRWVDVGDGTEVCLELCDACEAGYYGDIAVSDFLLPSFFAPGSKGPYTFLQAINGAPGPSAPFRTAGGGYMIVRRSGGGETQVTGSLRPHMKAKKKSATSRSFRRGLRLP